MYNICTGSFKKVPSKKLCKTFIFSCHLEGHWRKYQDPESDPDPLVRGMDPDPNQNGMDPQH
jgi:hypothetical protein